MTEGFWCPVRCFLSRYWMGGSWMYCMYAAVDSLGSDTECVHWWKMSECRGPDESLGPDCKQDSKTYCMCSLCCWCHTSVLNMRRLHLMLWPLLTEKLPWHHTTHCCSMGWSVDNFAARGPEDMSPESSAATWKRWKRRTGILQQFISITRRKLNQ